MVKIKVHTLLYGYWKPIKELQGIGGRAFMHAQFLVITSKYHRVQTPGYIPKKTRWVFWVHPPKKSTPQKPTLLL